MLLSPLCQVSVFIFPPIQASTIQQQSTQLNDNNSFKPAVKNHIQQVRLTYRGMIRPERQADNAELPAPVMTQQITQCRDESEGCSNHSLTGFHDGCCCACVRACAQRCLPPAARRIVQGSSCDAAPVAFGRDFSKKRSLNGCAGEGRWPPQETATTTESPPPRWRLRKERRL